MTYYHELKPSNLLKQLGIRRLEPGHAHASWGEVSWRGPFQLGLGVSHFEEHYSFVLHLAKLSLYIRLPWEPKRLPFDMVDTWGVKYVERAFHLGWGKHSKVHFAPWDWYHIGSEHKILMASGRWASVEKRNYSKNENPNYLLQDAFRFRETYPYHYMLDGGEVQTVDAEVTVERREWRWKALRNFPFPSKKRTYIDVKFSDEVGAARGSWKGGTIGCSYEMQDGETPKQTLMRMQRERKFR